MVVRFDEVKVGTNFKVGDCTYVKTSETPLEFHTHNDTAVNIGYTNAKHMTAAGKTVYDYFGVGNMVEVE